MADNPDEPDTAALPEPPKEAVPPPVVWPEPLAAVCADGPEAPLAVLDVSLAWACAVPGPEAETLLPALAELTPPPDGALEAEPLPAPEAEALPLACASDADCAEAVPDCAAPAWEPALAEVLAFPPPTLAAAAPLPAAAAAALLSAADTPPAVPVASPMLAPPPVEDALAADFDPAWALPLPAEAVSDADAPLLAVPAPFTSALPLVFAPAEALLLSALAVATVNDSGSSRIETGNDAASNDRLLMLASRTRRDRVFVMG
ncbi:MAG: hypothetical protein KGK10_00380 [Rhodospirillales bacterium]|nr:hypothetical protein [Rhodospirillales bacterium]